MTKRAVALVALALGLAACTPAQISAAIHADEAARGARHTWACHGGAYGFSGYDRDLPHDGCVRVPNTWTAIGTPVTALKLGK